MSAHAETSRLQESTAELYQSTTMLLSPSNANYDDNIDDIQELAMEEFLANQPLDWYTSPADPSTVFGSPLSPSCSPGGNMRLSSAPASTSSPSIAVGIHQHTPRDLSNLDVAQLQVVSFSVVSGDLVKPMTVEADTLVLSSLADDDDQDAALQTGGNHTDNGFVKREKKRHRQRGYEKSYRGRKKDRMVALRKIWLALEMELQSARKMQATAVVTGGNTSLRGRLQLLYAHERALKQDRIAMKTKAAWNELTVIREYTDKKVLRTMSEWKHSSEKIVGSNPLNPYTPLTANFTW